MVACENEKFKVDVIEDWDNDKDMMKYFYEEVAKQGCCDFGLEEAIRDYILMDGEFNVQTGRYEWIVDSMQCEVYDIKHYEESEW